jgi:hypothetical protein
MMKTSELTGSKLAEWVARANAWTVERDGEFPEAEYICVEPNGDVHSFGKFGYRPDLNWSQAGPIIERSIDQLEHSSTDPGFTWNATNDQGDVYWGDTALEAAMRAYVASKYGANLPEVE